MSLESICTSIVISRFSKIDIEDLIGQDVLPFVALSSFHSKMYLDIRDEINLEKIFQKKWGIVNQECVLASLSPNSKQFFAFYSPNIHSKEVALSPFIAILVPKEGIDAAFLVNELSQQYVTLQLERALRGGDARRTFLIQDLRSIQLSLPPINDREK